MMHASLPLTLRRSEQGGGRKPSACVEVKALRGFQMHAILPLTLLTQSRGEERTFGLHWKSRRCVSDLSDARQDAAEIAKVEQG